MELFIENRKIVLDIYSRYKDKLPDLYEKIKASAPKMLMSKDRSVSTYGMFVPHEDMKFVEGEYKGNLTKKEETANYKYYFDDQDRVVLTVRVNETFNNADDFIFYFYIEDAVEIVWYNEFKKYIKRIDKLVFHHGRIHSFLIASTKKNEEESNRGFCFREYTYHYGDGELELHLEVRHMQDDLQMQLSPLIASSLGNEERDYDDRFFRASKVERYRYP